MTQLQSSRAQRAQYTHIGLSMATLIVLSLVLPNLSVIVMRILWPGYVNHPWAVLTVNYGLHYLLAYPYVFLWLRLRTVGVPPRKQMGPLQFLSTIPVCFALMYLGNIVGNLVNSVIGLIRGQMPDNDLESFVQNYDTWLLILFVVILGPLLEELIFRKAITDALYPLGEPACVGIGALIFGLIHGNFYQFFYAALLGGLLTLIYCRTGKLRYTILLHMLINFQGSILSSAILRQMDKIGEQFTPEAILPALLVFGYSAVMLALAILGVILLIRGRDKLQLRKSALPLVHPLRNALLSPGMLVFYVAAIGTILLRL